MKRFLLFTLLSPVFFVQAQVLKPDGVIDTVVVANYSKQQLYSNALAFLNNSFKDSRSVVEMKDMELGEIAFNGNTVKAFTRTLEGKRGKTSEVTENVRLYFKCKVYVKENKFKLSLSGLEYPISELLGIDTKFPVNVVAANESQKNRIARELGENLVRDMAFQINKKPENDF